MIFRRLRLRLALINSAALVVMVAMLVTGAFLVSNRIFLQQEQAPLESDARQAASEYQEHGPVSFQFEHGGYQLSGDFYVLWNDRGQVIFNPSTLSASPLRASALSVAQSQKPSFSLISLPSGQVLIYTTTVISHDPTTGTPQLAVLQVGRSLATVTRSESNFLTILGGVALAGLILSLVTGWALAGRALVPIERAFDQQRQFLANASHELRTPLAVLDASLQVMRRHPERRIEDNPEILGGAVAEVERMRRLVEDLLTLARTDSGRLDLDLQEEDLDELLKSVVQDLGPLAAEHGSSLVLGSLPGGLILADHDRLRQLLVILMDNALVHTPRRTRVTVAGERRGREVVLTVADDGEGIPPEQREIVFERFQRLSEGRLGRGTGLGLAIAKGLAEAHGGRIRLADNRPGLRVEVHLPVSGPQAAA